MYEFLIQPKKAIEATDVQFLILERVVQYSKEKDINFYKSFTENQISLNVGGNSFTLFNSGAQIILFSNDDFGDGNFMLDQVLQSLLEEKHIVRCLHLSNINIHK